MIAAQQEFPLPDSTALEGHRTRNICRCRFQFNAFAVPALWRQTKSLAPTRTAPHAVESSSYPFRRPHPFQRNRHPFQHNQHPLRLNRWFPWPNRQYQSLNLSRQRSLLADQLQLQLPDRSLRRVLVELAIGSR